MFRVSGVFVEIALFGAIVGMRCALNSGSALKHGCRKTSTRQRFGQFLNVSKSPQAGSLYERWIFAIRPGDPFCFHAPMPDDARGEGLIEAARGALGHWLEVRKGRILNYQIVAPTTWSFSPRDAQGKPGACEQALVGAPTKR